MPEAGVEFAKVSYALPSGRLLLQDISLELAAGTTTALLGRSGAGKTTLLRTVNGLVTPTSGDVFVSGKSNLESNLISLRRSIGYVIQETGLFPHMTVEKNVGIALELDRQRGGANNKSRSLRDDKRRVGEVLELVGMGGAEFGGRYPWQLSGGQRQRVGLARALAGDPAVLLMDEPFGALDPLTRAEMQTMLKELLERVKKTVLLVTHSLDEALYLAQRVVFLAEGQVVADLDRGDVVGSNNPHVKDYVQAVHRMVNA